LRRIVSLISWSYQAFPRPSFNDFSSNSKVSRICISSTVSTWYQHSMLLMAFVNCIASWYRLVCSSGHIYAVPSSFQPPQEEDDQSIWVCQALAIEWTRLRSARPRRSIGVFLAYTSGSLEDIPGEIRVAQQSTGSGGPSWCVQGTRPRYYLSRSYTFVY